MCIICVKKSGVEFPSIESMKTCFENNPDGAGMMYSAKGKVKILKGIMTWKKYAEIYDKISRLDKKIQFIFHFRIGTHGKKNHPSYTHPFPLSTKNDDLLSTKITAKIGITHNGIIDNINFGSGLSDTMEFIGNILTPLLSENTSINSPVTHSIISNILGAGNKLAILQGNGKIETYGDFIDDNGLLYSNSSYKPYTYRYTMRDDSKCEFYDECYNAGFLCSQCKKFDCFDDMYGDINGNSIYLPADNGGYNTNFDEF